MAEITPDHWLMAPACWLIAERVRDPEPGMHWKKLPVRFARPSDRHCWLMSSRCFVCAAIAFAIAIASRSPSVAIANAVSDSFHASSMLNGGMWNDGSVGG